MLFKIKNHDVFPRFCGVSTAILGILVLFGWYTHNESLIQVLPHFAPMQYNTALGFLFSGIGLSALTIPRLNFAKICGGAVTLLGILTLIQYVLGFDFGIDELLMKAYITVKTSHLGRMAPNTALCFTLVGLFLLVGHRDRTLQISLAATVIILSVLSFIGYLANIEGIYGWGNLTRMAVHTAISFLILGAGMMSLAFSRKNQTKLNLWRAAPFTLSSIVLTLSMLSSYGMKEAIQVHNTEYFERLVSNTHNALVDRYTLYEHSLFGGRGMFYASKSVERHEWTSYIDALNIHSTLPGISGIGYISSVQADGLSEYLKKTRKDNAPDFTNHPETPYSDKFVITFIEPEDVNMQAVGLDIGFEERRRAAAERARDYGVPALTQKIELVQDSKRTPGFLLLVPVYSTKTPPATIEERKANINGWVYAPFIGSNFMQGLMEMNYEQVGFDVYDGEILAREALIFSTDAQAKPDSAYTKQTVVDIAGRRWIINWYATTKFVPPSNENLPIILLSLGFVCTILLYLVLFRLLRSKELIAREVEKQTERLFKSEAQLQLVFDNAGEGIYGLDLQGHVIFSNQASQTLLGYTLEDMLNISLHDLIHHTHDNGTAYKKEDCTIYKAIYDGETHTVDTDVFWHKDGTALAVEYTSTPIRGESEEITGAVVVFRDISERKAADDEIKQANAELEEFAYRTSHDLRSPLISSISLLDIANKAIQSDQKDTALTSLTHARKSLQKLEDLVKDILVLTQTKNMDEDEDVINVEELIHDTLEKLGHMSHFERLDIRQNLKFSDTISMKKSRITLVVENLISNAVKYQDVEKENSFIQISTYKEADHFVLEVKDNGLGIPEDQHANLFQMFKRFHPKSSFGSGLGLYMIKKSADILGGDIYFEALDDGSVFQLRIPLTQ